MGEGTDDRSYGRGIEKRKLLEKTNEENLHTQLAQKREREEKQKKTKGIRKSPNPTPTSNKLPT